MGPSAIRYAGLDTRLTEIGRRVEDRGNVETAVAEAAEVGEPNARYLLPVLRTCERVAALVRRTAEAGAVPLVLGGDHSVAIGSIGGLAAAYGSGGVLWLDAHGDLNTPETSPTGNVHGMVLAAVLGLGGPVFESAAWPTPAIDPERVALVGVRSLDEGERERVRSLGAKVFTMSDSCTSAWTWTSSIPRSHPVSARRCAVDCRTARRTLRSSSSQSWVSSRRSTSSR